MNEAPSQDRVQLGSTGITIAAIGVGTWAWGDKLFWGYGKGGYSDDDLHAAFEGSVQAGINFFDTAEAYGRGRSETLLGHAEQTLGRRVIIATKLFPYPYRLSSRVLVGTLNHSLRRLGRNSVDLYQMHWPFPPVPIRSWMHAMADAKDEGLTQAVGVSNYNLDQTRTAVDALDVRDVRLASNQVEFHLLQRKHERSGLLQYCRDHQITLLAYSPLAMGLLSGKYTPANPPPGMRGRRYRSAYLARIQPLLDTIRRIGDAQGKTPAQIALNWVLCKGAVPIPGAKNLRQAQENAAALGWRLSSAQVATLDEASDGVGT